jgi:hypothetical protein
MMLKGSDKTLESGAASPVNPTARPSEKLNIDLEKAMQDNSVCFDNGKIGTKNHDISPALEVDQDLVGWDGPEDPQNPMNWPGSKKYIQLGVMALNTFLT